jgi:hypothetical protein
MGHIIYKIHDQKTLREHESMEIVRCGEDGEPTVAIATEVHPAFLLRIIQ